MHINEIFNEKYRIKKLLGKGNRSRVYLAENIRLGTLWAVKEIEKGSGLDNLQVIEPDILKKLDHPSLPRIFDVLENDTHIYIIMDYIKGAPLDKKLQEEGRFPEQRVIEWGLEICDVLAYLHGFKPNPIIYRDMKPSNIILNTDGRLKLVDFGIAREYKVENTDDTVYIGTRGYAAPEQYGRGQTSAASDIYSLGVTMHHLVTGEGPDRLSCMVRPIREIDDDLSEGLEEVIGKCTAQSPGDRYSSALELKNALSGIYSRHKDNRSGNIAAEKVPPTFKRIVITVWDGAEFGCELAYISAKLSGMDVLLADLDLLAPSVDICLNVPKYPEYQPDTTIIKSTGLDMVLRQRENGNVDRRFFERAAVRRRELDNLHILTGSYCLDDYEYYSEDTLAGVIEDAYRNYDITVLLANRSIYDAFTVVALASSDYIIKPVAADVLPLRTFNTYRDFLEEKQGIAADKYRFVVFDADPRYKPDIDMLKVAVGDGYIGQIGYSGKRCEYRNRKSVYARKMEKNILEDYRKILCRFGIAEKKGFVKRFATQLRGLAGSLAENRGG